MDRAERKAATAVTPSAASEAVKDARRALDTARRMRGPAGERASLVRELERKLERMKRAADSVAPPQQATAEQTTSADRLSRMQLGVPAHAMAVRITQPAEPAKPPVSAPVRQPQGPARAVDARRPALVASLPLPVPDDLVVERVEQLSLDFLIAPADLQPNTAYVYGENVYVTDASARPAYMHGIAKYTPDAPRVNHVQRQVGHDGQAAAGGRFGRLVGGHMGGVALGGYPSGPNLFAQNSQMNIGAFATFEIQFRDLARNGSRVDYSVRLATDAKDDEVVSVAILSYSIDGVDQGEYPLINEPHQYR
jgi:hypothetical protein